MFKMTKYNDSIPMPKYQQLPTWKVRIKILRWAKLPLFLTNICFQLGLSLDDIEVKKGWFFETVYFEITGSKSILYRFIRTMKQTFFEYNKTGYNYAF